MITATNSRRRPGSAWCPRASWVVLVTAVVLAAGCGGPHAARAATGYPFAEHLPAPPLDGGVEWLNTDRPLKLADFRGKFVLLDFWTYCCINCMHVLPEIKKLEHAFPNELVVIGVHSGKFDEEHDSQNIREAVMRYEIEHPVVNDAELAIWRRYGVNTWPTLVLIDPTGEAVWLARGEQKFEDLRDVLQQALPYYRQHHLLSPGPFKTKLEADRLANTPLEFPGKVLADQDGGRLFIADSNHNRIVVADLDGHLQYTIGSGKIGRADGPIAEAAFHHPQGMALAGDWLYVADTENHLLRKINLAERRVVTVAGTGKQGSGWPGLEERTARGQQARPRRYVGRPKSTPLSSPWALLAHDNELYIAMAGSHQIWRMPLDERVIGPYAGNGREGIADGALLPRIPYAMDFASFAQPSGLASDGRQLFVADSEGSAIRTVPFDSTGSVETIVGVLGSLFDFGDQDGAGRAVRLQHPLGVAYADGQIFVADTYNNKIKVINTQRQCRTLAGTGQAGRADAAEGARASFNEPGGISVAGDRLFVADTNNHVIRVVELTEPHRVTTLTIDGLTPPAPP
jgi:thiol-disulfide isomerase/thioredoxin